MAAASPRSCRTELALHHRPRPLDHGHDQRHRLHLGLGQHLPVQPLPVPLGQPPVPGLAVDGDGRLRGPHGEDGRGLQGRSAWPSSSSPASTTPAEHDEFFTYFNWQQFTDEEWELCPPVVAVGGDGAMYDIGFQNLSRADGLGQADQGAGASTRRSTPTPAARPAPRASSARSPTWPSTARRSRARRSRARRSA